MVVFAILALAAISVSAQDDISKAEFFGGYSFLNLDTGLDELDSTAFNSRETMHGFNASITGNASKWVGLKFDYSRYSKSFTVPDISGTAKVTTSEYLGGVQIKNNKEDGPVAKPFAHILAGIAQQKFTATGFFSDVELAAPSGSVTTLNTSNNSFAMVFGGGLDVKVHKHVDIRVFQFDYNPIFFRGNTDLALSKHTQQNIRMAFGIVIH